MGGLVGMGLLAAAQLAQRALSSPHAVGLIAAAAATAICSVALWVLGHSLLRGGTLRAVFDALRGEPNDGICLSGARVWPRYFAAAAGLTLLDLLMAATLLAALQLMPLVASHGVAARVVGAGFVAFTALLAVCARAFATAAAALTVLDETDLGTAWQRLRKRLGTVDAESSDRFVTTLLVAAALLLSLGLAEMGSSAVSSFMDAGSAGVANLLLLGACVQALYAFMLDVVVVTALTALTERLPIGLAARVTLRPPPAAEAGPR